MNTDKILGRSGLLSLLLIPFVAGAQISFTDESAGLDLNNVQYESWGAAWGDLNTDGYPDLYMSNHRNYGQMVVNQKDGTFAKADNADVDGLWSSGFAHYDDHGASWADMDNDGDLDLLLSEAVRHHRWLRNDNGLLHDHYSVSGQGYTPIAREHGTRIPAYFEFSRDCGGGPGAWGVLTELNNTGRLDMMCSRNGGTFPHNVVVQGGGPAVTLPSSVRVMDFISGDFNGDQFNDYILLNGRDRPNGAYLVDANTVESQMNVTNAGNNQELTIVTTGSLTLHDINSNTWRHGSLSRVRIGPSGYQPSTETFTLDVNSPSNWGLEAGSTTTDLRLFVGYDTAAGAWIIRFNSTGNWRYIHFVATSDAPITSVTQPSSSSGDKPAHPRLYHGSTNGFVFAGNGVGLSKVLCSSGVAADFDNDMDLDVYAACQSGAANTANVLFENDGTGQFTKILNHGAEGVIGGAIADEAGNADSVVTADYNVDGAMDLFVVNGMNMRPKHYGGPKQLFAGTPNGNGWLMFDLVGTSSNRDGIGAKLLITTPDGKVQYREQNGGYHRWSQNHMRVHVGLGTNLTADVEVQWPSGHTDVFTGVNRNVVYKVTEAGTIDSFIVPIVDSDNDGLSDDDENNVHGTDPNNPDTDGGGLQDGYEVQNGTDPLDPADDAGDSDGDGLTDSEEQALGTDPNNPDTDGEKLWDGLEVNTYGTDPLHKNTDRDGINDYVEVTFKGTDPLDADSDDDGLTDGEEASKSGLGTDPLDPDTDDGGTNDGTEVTNGTDPFDPADD